MTVNLSALAGAGQQFFNNSGVILTGGKLYSYAAGTTTPQTTYTTAAGNVAHTNPIVLDSAGRVATGEIWLTANSNYKFVLKDSNDVLIATWDNITGINGTGIATNASNVQYDPAGSGAVSTTVQAKLRQYVSVKDFGAVGDGITDDTAAIQNAINAAKNVYIPAGNYLCNSPIQLNAGNVIYGDGIANTILYRNFNTNAAKGVLWCDSGSASVQLDGIHLSDFAVDGMNTTYGFTTGQQHNLSLSGVKNAVVERVKMFNAQADCFYLGSGVVGGVERHNTNVVFRDCVFSGYTIDMRNGLSLIDYDGCVVDSCLFEGIGASTLSRSVGGIDVEPDNTFSNARNLRVVNCTFKDLNRTNIVGIAFFNNLQVGANIYGCVIDNCSFENCYWTVVSNSNAGIETPRAKGDNLVVNNCQFLNSVNADVILYGTKNVLITNNTFEVYPAGSTSYRGSIQLATSDVCIDIKITNNTFSGLRPQFGCIYMNGARNLVIDKNTFNDIGGNGLCINMDTPAAYSIYENLTITNNVVYNELYLTAGSPQTVYFVRSPGTINTSNDNSFINYKNYYANNIMNDGVSAFQGYGQVLFNNDFYSGSPTGGTWQVGSYVNTTAPAAGDFRRVCSVSGTFGTLSGASGDATNGTKTLLNVVDTNSSLREGQFILVSGDAAVNQILLINGSTVYLANAYAGVTGTGKALSWSAPTFVTV